MNNPAANPFLWKPLFHRGRFRNPCTPLRRGLKEVFRWKLGLAQPDQELPAPPGNTAPPSLCAPNWEAIRHPPADRIAATWIGHSTFLLQCGGLNLLTDPVFGDYCAPVPAERFRRVTPPGLAIAELPRIDAVLLSHNHYDHLERDSLLGLGRNIPLFCPTGLGSLLANWGFSQITECGWGESVGFRGSVLTALPAQHGSARTPWDANRSLWCGWAWQQNGLRTVFLGDTGYAPFFAEFPDKLGPIDLALIPIGAYRPKWFMRPVHIDPFEAVQIHRELKPRLSLAMHWGTFALADEPAGEPPLLLAQARELAGVSPEEFRILRPGELALPPR